MNGYAYEVLDRLIAADTVSTKSDLAAMEYLAGECERLSLKTVLHRSTIAKLEQANLLAWTGPPAPDGLIISGHLDTVPFEGQPGWNREALKLGIEDTHLYGRGVSDMKGFLAQCLEAARELDPERLRRPVVFLFTASEEIGGLGARNIAPALQDLLGAVPCPKLAWIGEPTSYAIHAAHKSASFLEIRVRGRGGHSGAPHRGVNAIAVMGKVIGVIGQLQEERRAHADPEFVAMFPDSPHDVMNFGTIRGGIAENVIAEECVMRVSYRSLPGIEGTALREEIARRCATLDLHDHAGREFGATIEVGEAKVMPAMAARRGTALEKVLCEVAGAKEVSGAPFCTDGGWLADVGISSLICGPGDYAQAHQPNESIPRAAFERGPALIREVIEKLCSSP